MSKVIDLKSYKEARQKNKVIEVDFKTRTKKKTKLVGPSILSEGQVVEINRSQNKPEPDGVA